MEETKEELEFPEIQVDSSDMSLHLAVAQENLRKNAKSFLAGASDGDMTRMNQRYAYDSFL